MNPRTYGLLAVLAVLAPLPALAAFQCPAVDPIKTEDTPALSADETAGPEGTVSTSLQGRIHSLQAAGLKAGDIVDRLVVADCSHVEGEPGLSDAGKAHQVRRFAAKLATFLYAGSGPKEEDIVVDVPVPTAVYDRVRLAATKAGVSEDAWVNQAIATHLGTP